eukprot:NODE_487_length_2995_cov_6.779289.p1 GENE.NODE_487_length_2995_cov_6.779289~~NODE_487_length_2995_cov_6.779289.p1  ORF type:complete len:854 (-),score=245.54 NODE_487_length_2995_cov_6.779289:434-2800(-)
MLSKCFRQMEVLSQVLAQKSHAMLGAAIDERTPTQVCWTGEEAPLLEPPEADDLTLGDFLHSYRRTVLRIVHFLGPLAPHVLLRAKVGWLPDIHKNLALTMPPNSMLIFRPECYHYSWAAPARPVLLASMRLLARARPMIIESVDGNRAVLDSMRVGSQPPTSDVINVLNVVTRLSMQADEPEYYGCALACGGDGVIKVPAVRWDVNAYYTKDAAMIQPWQTTCQHQGFVDGADLFDHKYFDISVNEAKGMDPVQRLILETGALSLGKTGILKKDSGKIAHHAGFCVGNDKVDWAGIVCSDTSGKVDASAGGGSTALAILANRFNYVFNLKGPSFVCDTACSASLVSTHLAKAVLRERRYDPLEWFLSMGAHLCLSPIPFIGCAQAHMQTIRGRCFTFDSSADGYLRGEGISGMMLKYSSVRDDLQVILRGTAAGQDGRSASLTAPNGPAQAFMIRCALAEAHISPAEGQVWECHGTGTSLGDPIEVGAVNKVQAGSMRTETLLLSSAKANIGHLEGGAAMGGMVKCVLQVLSSISYPSLHLRLLNPHLNHDDFMGRYNTELLNYGCEQGHSQISSFGFGGTNGHAIFWGLSSETQELDSPVVRLIRRLPAPKVHVHGADPDSWGWDFPDLRDVKPNDFLSASMHPDHLDQAPLWSTTLPRVKADEDLATYNIAGDFSEWEGVLMDAGAVPGLHVTVLEVPPAGAVTFHFRIHGDDQKILAPDTDGCSRASADIVGPAEHLSNVWSVTAPPGALLQVELFVRQGRRSVLWFDKELLDDDNDTIDSDND